MRATLCLRVGNMNAQAELLYGSRVIWRGEAAFTTPKELVEAVSQLVSSKDVPARPPVLRVEVAPPLAQVRTLRDLPPVRHTQLQALVATQAFRFFRRNGKPLVTVAWWPSRADRRQGRALAAAVEEPWLEAVIEGARVAGLTVASLGPANLPLGIKLAMLPPAERRRQRDRAKLSVRRLGIAAGVIWLAAGGVTFARFQHERARLDREIAQLERTAMAVREARYAVGKAAAMVETIERARHERTQVLARLAAIGAALPDSAFVISLVLGTSGGGQVAVTAPRSAEVVHGLNRAGIPSPRFEGAAVREDIGGADRERVTVVFGAETPR